MKTKHTPSPWNVLCIEGLSDWAFLGVVSDESTKAVCHIHFEATIENGKVKIPDECKSKAKLIAAAPDLLEACINSFKTFHSIGCTMEAEIMQELESAIKKATE